MKKSIRFASVLAWTALAVSPTLSGCANKGAGGGAVDSENAGAIGLVLSGSGVALSSATYSITGPGGFSTSGTVNLTAATSLSFVVGGIPAGTGYSIVVTAQSADGSTTCGGSSTFSITAKTTTSVSVALDCHQATRTGSVSVNGTVNICPTIDALSVSPSQVAVGSGVSLSGTAHDPDNGPAALAYQWTASSGTFSDATAQSPSFTCAAPGIATVTLTVSDGDSTSGCPATLSAQVVCTTIESGVVQSALFIPGSATEPNLAAGYWQGAKVCADANGNGRCDFAESPAVTDGSGHFAVTVSGPTALIADVGTDAINTANGAANPSRTVFRLGVDQAIDQGLNVVLSGLSTEIVRAMEANGSSYATEKATLAARLSSPSVAVSAAAVIADASGLSGSAQAAVLKEENILTNRFRYAIAKYDRGDLYPDALAVAGGDPELTGLPGVTPLTASVTDTRQPITFLQAQQAAFAVEGIPRYDHLFIVMLENKSTQAMLSSTFAPKINALLQANNYVSSYYATGQPSEPNYTALGGADDWGITDDSQWNCDATGPNAPQDLPLPTNTQPGLASSPFAATCTQSVGVNHNIVGRQNVFTATSAAGMTWRTYSESMNPGQDFRIDSVQDNAVVAPDEVYPPGTLSGNTTQIGNPNLLLPMPAGLYKTKHHPGMAYQNVRSAPEFRYSNRTLGGGQWDSALVNSSAYAIPAGYDIDQLGTDLASGNVGNLNFVIPDQCDDMHGITVSGTVSGTTTKGTASDCSSVGNNVLVTTGGNILTRGDNYVDKLVKRIQASPLWQNTAKKEAIVLMFDEGNATAPDINSCCGWKAGKTALDNPLVQNPDGTFSPDTSIHNYAMGNQGHGKSIFVVITNQPTAPKGIVDNDSYSHFSFVRTLQDMFGLSDPAKDGSYMNRSKYTEKFIAQNILNLPEFVGSADTHFDAVRPLNHTYVIPATYVEKATLDDTRPPQVGPDATQVNVWATK
ncbi:MAG TPA: PKD domain-containing protein [Polyangia bacterium]